MLAIVLYSRRMYIDIIDILVYVDPSTRDWLFATASKRQFEIGRLYAAPGLRLPGNFKDK